VRDTTGFPGVFDAGIRSRRIAGDLHQIAVGIPEVDRLHRTPGPGSRYRTFNDVYPSTPEMMDDFLHRRVDHQADVLGSGCGMRRFGLEFFPTLMEIDPGLADVQCLPSPIEGYDFHAECLRVEGAGDINVLDGEYNMVDALYSRDTLLSGLISVSLHRGSEIECAGDLDGVPNIASSAFPTKLRNVVIICFEGTTDCQPPLQHSCRRHLLHISLPRAPAQVHSDGCRKAHGPPLPPAIWTPNPDSS
jgi:hypothetical protein